MKNNQKEAFLGTVLTKYDQKEAFIVLSCRKMNSKRGMLSVKLIQTRPFKCCLKKKSLKEAFSGLS